MIKTTAKYAWNSLMIESLALAFPSLLDFFPGDCAMLELLETVKVN
jgi:hypothetical protein